MEPEPAFSLVTTGYYRGVPADAVGPALQHCMRMLEESGWPADARLAPVLYLFCRIAQVSPDARRAISAQQAKLTGLAGEVTAKILESADDAAFSNALTQPITGPASLDELWAEFFVTGAPEPVRRIVSVLDAPDGIRRQLGAWLQKRSWFGGSKRAEQAETLRRLGVVMDLKTKTIITEGDLDCICFALAEQNVPIFKLLPCALSQDDLLNLCIKGSALWSLRLNSRDHEAVRAVCEEEHARPGGPGRVRLVEAIDGQKPFAL